jgi:hypothetical protein
VRENSFSLATSAAYVRFVYKAKVTPDSEKNLKKEKISIFFEKTTRRKKGGLHTAPKGDTLY